MGCGASSSSAGYDSGVKKKTPAFNSTFPGNRSKPQNTNTTHAVGVPVETAAPPVASAQPYHGSYDVDGGGKSNYGYDPSNYTSSDYGSSNYGSNTHGTDNYGSGNGDHSSNNYGSNNDNYSSGDYGTSTWTNEEPEIVQATAYHDPVRR